MTQLFTTGCQIHYVPGTSDRCSTCGAERRWVTPVDDEKIKSFFVAAMKYSDNIAAWNRGGNRDFYEQVADRFVEDLKAALGSEDDDE
jgi:hypothetical protein